MDLNEKNGQPSMEEILASIRRIIAEEPTSANPVIDLNAKYKSKGTEHEESNDFELPSIFRPNPQAAQERQPLFGRLTDAIRNASGTSAEKSGRVNGASSYDGAEGEAQERYRGALRDSGSVLAVAGGAASNAHLNSESGERYRGALRDSGSSTSLTSALSSLKLTRGEAQPSEVKTEPVLAPAPAAEAYVSEPAPAAPAPAPLSSAPAEDVRRVMVPFKDMRMSRMGTGSDHPAPALIESPSLESLISSASTPHVETPSYEPPPAQTPYETLTAAPPIPANPYGFEQGGFSLDDMHRVASVVEQAVHRPPPPPPAAASADRGIEDATADLLRPMLRQWLAENMPRMVEKALSIELAESVKVNRKFTGS